MVLKILKKIFLLLALMVGLVVLLLVLIMGYGVVMESNWFYCKPGTLSDEVKIGAEAIIATMEAGKYDGKYGSKRQQWEIEKDKCGLYIADGPERSYLTDKLSVGFVRNVPEKLVDEMLKTEKLIETGKRSNYGNRIWVSLETNGKSKYRDGWRMASYLEDKYPIVESASMNAYTPWAEWHLLGNLGQTKLKWPNLGELGWNIFKWLKFKTMDRGEFVDWGEEETKKIDNKIYVEGLGVIEENEKQKYYPEWNTVVEFKPRTLKEGIDLYRQLTGEAENVGVWSYVMIEVDHQGRAEEYHITFESKEENKQRVMVVRPGTIQGELLIMEEKLISGRRLWKANELRDSREIVEEAMEKRDGCAGQMDVSMIGWDEIQTHVVCFANKWEFKTNAGQVQGE